MILQLIAYILLIGVIGVVLFLGLIGDGVPRTWIAWIDRLVMSIGVASFFWFFSGGLISFFYHVFLQIELNITHFIALPALALGPFFVVAGCYLIVRHRGAPAPDQRILVEEGINAILLGMGWISILLWSTFVNTYGSSGG